MGPPPAHARYGTGFLRLVFFHHGVVGGGRTWALRRGQSGMDLLAQWRREHGLRALSVNWGTWQEMRVASEADKEQFAKSGLHTMPDAQALAALERLISTDRASAIVASIDWNAFRAVYEARRARPLFAEMRSRPRNENAAIASKKSAAAASEISLQLKSASPARRRDILIAHLRSQASSILGFDLSREIDLEQGLFDMGMDSLMAVELRDDWNEAWACPFPRRSPLTIQPSKRWSIIFWARLFGFDSAPATEEPTQILTPAPAKALPADQPSDDLSEDEISLLLLAKAGTDDDHERQNNSLGSRAAGEIQKLVVASFAYLIPVAERPSSLPGRNFCRRSWTSVQFNCRGGKIAIAKPLSLSFIRSPKIWLMALEPYLDRPYILYGYSLGALIAFELARQLRRQKIPPPVALYTLARPAPHLPQTKDPLHQLPDDSFVQELIRRFNGMSPVILQDQELMKLLLPTLRADVTALETYVYQDEEPLDCPIRAFGGRFDSTTTEDDLRAWQLHTNSSFELEMFHGDHFFIRNHQQSIFRSIAAVSFKF